MRCFFLPLLGLLTVPSLSAKPDPRLLFHAPLDGDGSELVSGKALTAKGKLQWVNGIHGKALYLDGKSEACLTFPSSLNPKLGNLTHYTVSLWVQVPEQSPIEAAALSTSSYITANIGHGWRLSHLNNKAWNWFLSDSITYSSCRSNKLFHRNPGWHHIAIRNDRDKSAQLFIDGEKVDNSNMN